MGRPLGPTAADVVYHVLNRANGRQRLFDDDGDYMAFERVDKVELVYLPPGRA